MAVGAGASSGLEPSGVAASPGDVAMPSGRMKSSRLIGSLCAARFCADVLRSCAMPLGALAPAPGAGVLAASLVGTKTRRIPSC